MSKFSDRELGMSRRITRRDFLDGVAVVAAASLAPPRILAARDTGANPEKSSEYYPPALTGLRGSHPGSFEVAHSLRDGTFWPQAGTPIDSGETYDLIVVGGGISGLASAHFFRKTAGPKARILILDNHDDFGGHAKRNEFRIGNTLRLGYGGAFAIQSPAPYSSVAQSLVRELGIDVAAYYRRFSKHVYGAHGLVPGIFFDKETFGADQLTVDPAPLDEGETDDCDTPQAGSWKRFLSEAPLTDTAKADVQRLFQSSEDYLPGLDSDQKKFRLARMSYASFLSDTAKVSQEIVGLYQAAPQGLFGVGIDAISAQDAWGLGFPGFQGMHLDAKPGRGMNRDAIPNEEAEKAFFHFPDGNASIARLLLRRLIPQAIPGQTGTDIVLARANYANLDQAAWPVRVRLNSTVVRVKHAGDPASAKEVEVTYARSGKVYTARTARCILACWHMVIPYLCEELPEKQRDAMAYAAKVPLLYTNVAVKNWTAFQKLGICSVYAPNGYHSRFNLDVAVSMGGYECARRPEEPIVVHMMKTPCKPGLPARDQHRIGRFELFTTDFETIERNIREQLARTLNPGGFDPARDITAITVNRWPHGFAYQYNSLWDEFWIKGGEAPCEVARRPFGRIAIANSDAGAYAYTDSAIDQAWRAVREVTRQ